MLILLFNDLLILKILYVLLYGGLTFAYLISYFLPRLLIYLSWWMNHQCLHFFALKKNNVYFYGTMTARIALIVHNCFLWTAPFCFTRLSQNLSVSLHLHGSHSFLAPGLAPPMLSDLKQDCHLLLSFSAQRRSYPALWHHKNLP